MFRQSFITSFSNKFDLGNLLFNIVENSRRLSSSDDDFAATYSNPNDNYKPNEYVEYGHMMSRNEDFEATEEAGKNALYMPAILLGLGILSFLFINMFLCFRCCCACIRCAPDVKAEKYRRKRLSVLLIFYFVVFVCLAFNQLLFYGNNYIADGVDTFIGAVNSVENLVNDLIGQADNLVSYASSMPNSLDAIIFDVNNCTYLSSGNQDIMDQLSSASSAMSEFSDMSISIRNETDSFDGVFDDFQDQVELYGNDYRFKMISGIWILPMLVMLLLMITHCFRSKLAMQCSIFCVWIVFWIFMILVTLWGLIITETGTFCMEPIYNLNNALPEGSMRNMSMYYTACMGSGLVDSMVNDTIGQVNTIQEALQNMSNTAANSPEFAQYCAGNTLIADIDTLQDQLDGVIDVIYSAISLTSCSTIQPIMFSLINDCLCTEMYTGIFFLWGSNLWTNMFIFIVVLVASYVWPYYPFWRDNNATTPNEFDGSDDGGVVEAEEDVDDHFLRREVSEFGGGEIFKHKDGGVDYEQIQSGPVVEPAGIAMVDMGVRPEDASSNRNSSSRKSGPRKVKPKKVSTHDDDDGEVMI